MSTILQGKDLVVPDGSGETILLINPPIYDAQYWSRWSQPAGLLRISTFLKQLGYKTTLIDCMEADAAGRVKKSLRKVGGSWYIQRDDIRRTQWHFGISWDEFRQRLAGLDAKPTQVWITSIMTYWWESTRDAVAEVKKAFPNATVFVGGIYPTLAPEHAAAHLGADFVVAGEIPQASEQWTDLDLYETPPSYAILATTRGCPWDCVYCAARTLNGGSAKVRGRSTEDVIKEIEDKVARFGTSRFGFYEDNALVLRGHLQEILQVLLDRKLKLDLYAPEGFETRFLTEELLKVMKKAGFKRIHLPFETLKMDTNIGWNRRHASTASFDRALDAAKAAGFKTHTQDLNAFVLFGLPDESLDDIMDSVLYVHNTVGSVVPMLFTPVPGTHIYKQHAPYLHEEMNWDLQNLNGKLLPFLEYNRNQRPELRASDYLELEKLMSVLNDGKFMSQALNLCSESRVTSTFRAVMLDKRLHVRAS
ncbi:MAG TPA: radical SAM protein [Fimbriimonadaceae bacterium]|nr:radical SAM protein [Fimbriimonadaceae bacterium]